MIFANPGYLQTPDEDPKDSYRGFAFDQKPITECFKTKEIASLRELALTLPNINNFQALTAPRQGKAKFDLSNKLIDAFRKFFEYEKLELDFDHTHPVRQFNQLLEASKNNKLIAAQSTAEAYANIRQRGRMRASTAIPKQYIELFAQEFRAALIWREYLSDFVARYHG